VILLSLIYLTIAQKSQIEPADSFDYVEPGSPTRLAWAGGDGISKITLKLMQGLDTDHLTYIMTIASKYLVLRMPFLRRLLSVTLSC
jgi:hypothetical protein